MIERIVVLALLLSALVLWLLGSSMFPLPLVLAIILGALFYRIENKRYKVKDSEYYIVDNAKLKSDE